MKKHNTHNRSQQQVKRRDRKAADENTSAARPPKSNALMKLFSDDEKLKAAVASVRDADGKAALSYLCVADRNGTRAMEQEMTRCVGEAVDSGSITGLAILYRPTSLSTTSASAVFENRQVRKEIARLKKDNPDSIARAITYPMPFGDEYCYRVAIAALVLMPEAAETPRLNTSTAAASMGLPADVCVQDPTTDDIARLVSLFWSAPAAIRRLAASAASNLNAKRCRQKRANAIVGIHLLDLTTPAKKMLVASGFGKEILSHAMTGPDARIKRASKTGLTREELTHLIWCHTLATNRPAPPLMKI